MDLSKIAFAVVLFGALPATSHAIDSQFNRRINTSAKSLAEALPAPAAFANERWDASVLEGNRRVPVDAVKPVLVEHCLRWIRRVINPEWLPEDGVSKERLQMVRGEVDSPDLVRATWESNGNNLEVTQMRASFVIRITPLELRSVGTTPIERNAFGKDIAARIFTDQDFRNSAAGQVVVEDVAGKISEYSFKPENVLVYEDGVLGVPLTKEQAGIQSANAGEVARDVKQNPESPAWDDTAASWSYWWRHVCWWNDGRTLAFYFPKREAGPYNILSYFTTGTHRWLVTKDQDRRSAESR